MKKKIILIMTLLLVPVILTGCGEKKEIKENLLGIKYNEKGNETTLDKYNTENPVVAMYIENYGSIVMELYPDKAPNTVNNFISLIKDGFYDNNTFHRLSSDFVLQGGDPTGTGTGGPGYSIKGEFSENGFETNDLKHEKGIISMARNSISMDSAGSQFFIMLDTASNLDGSYAAFGKIIDGWDNIDNIVENEKVINTDQLETKLKIKKTLIDLKGKEYSAVEKISES